ncbi:MAG: NnrS family protein [Hyphomicrobiaceae bacterium]|nr:NnrS family protein [Hyphomicrobiaceae bacterium]
MTSSAQQFRAYNGHALFSHGFRPFFLFGTVWAAVSVAIWLPMLSGQLVLPLSYAPVDWHAHELIFGYVPAVVAGFLLTAVPNWTGRLPVVGKPLAVLFATWVAGRIAMLVSAVVGPAIVAIVDLAFLALLVAVMGREIVAGGNTRNIKVLAGVALLLVANGLFHVEAAFAIGDRHGERLGVGATVLLLMLIGGRIIPSFTRNWLARQVPGRMPVSFDRTDALIMIASAGALGSWIALPDAVITAWLSIIAMAMNVYRLSRWAGWRRIAEPLVLVLHVAFAFVPVGFGLLALSILRPDLIALTGALHGFTAGAIGMMTLAVMTRASLGHTGQPLVASWPIVAIYVGAFLAAVARIIAAFDVMRTPMLTLSVVAWIAAFAGFVIVYAPLLLRRRSGERVG